MKSGKIFERLRAKLPAEERQLLDDYDDARVEIHFVNFLEYP